MADEDSEQAAPEPAGAPINRDRRSDPPVIEGEAVRHDEEPAQTSAEAAAPESSPPASSSPPREPKARRPGRFGAFVAGAVGGAIVAALALAGYFALAPKPGLSEEDANRIAALEAAAQKDSASGAANGKRLQALEQANAALSTEVKKLAAAPPPAPPPAQEDTGLADRVAKLEAAVSKVAAAPPAPPPDLAPVEARIGKIEQALDAEKSAQKTETRAAAEAVQAANRTEAIGVVASDLRDKLVAGEPFPQDLAALQSLGVDAAKLAPLKAVVGGAPTGPSLASAFAALAPAVLAEAAPKPGGSVADRFLAHLRGLVVVHELNETAGNDPDALATQVEALSRRGDLAGALAAFGKLPEPARKVAANWAADAGRAAAAQAALQSIRDEAIGRLAPAEKS
ncbi:MAG: hypothetical protein JOZ27_00540 [Caulobacteraceae bacterium]|nr:hypothetical protein [Caulobacteraceae bacterium]